MAYRSTMEMALNHRHEVAYRRHDCSTVAFTPISR